MKNISKTILTTSILFALTAQAEAASVNSRIKALEAKVAKMEKTTFKVDKFLKEHKAFGRLQYDKTFITNNNDLVLQNSSKLRRGRLGLKGKLAENWGYKIEVDFSGNASKVTDAYISKSLFDKTASIKIGQHKEPFSLDELTSSRFTSFIERASLNGYAPGRHIGVSFNKRFENVNFYSGVFGDDVDDSSSTDDESVSGAVRIATYKQDANKNTIHLAAAVRTSEPTGDSVSYSFKPEASVETSSSAVKTSTISNANQLNQLGLEFATVTGPLSLQGEYIKTEIDRDGDNLNLELTGHYVQASVFLTGEKKNYSTKSSAFGRVKPTSKKGAWELAYRHSVVDANDEDLQKGRMENNTVALNYYATDKVKLMANYIDVNVDKYSTYADDAEILAFRAQVDF